VHKVLAHCFQVGHVFAAFQRVRRVTVPELVGRVIWEPDPVEPLVQVLVQPTGRVDARFPHSCVYFARWRQVAMLRALKRDHTPCPCFARLEFLVYTDPASRLDSSSTLLVSLRPVSRDLWSVLRSRTPDGIQQTQTAAQCTNSGTQVHVWLAQDTPTVFDIRQLDQDEVHQQGFWHNQSSGRTDPPRARHTWTQRASSATSEAAVLVTAHSNPRGVR
jgi:hypothetical protein